MILGPLDPIFYGPDCKVYASPDSTDPLACDVCGDHLDMRETFESGTDADGNASHRCARHLTPRPPAKRPSWARRLRVRILNAIGR